jgi:hypothetical protein
MCNALMSLYSATPPIERRSLNGELFRPPVCRKYSQENPDMAIRHFNNLIEPPSACEATGSVVSAGGKGAASRIGVDAMNALPRWTRLLSYVPRGVAGMLKSNGPLLRIPLAWLALSLIPIGAHGQAAQTPPTIKVLQGTLVTPAAADALFAPTVNTTHSNDLGIAQSPAQIIELASGLGASQVIGGTLSQDAYAQRVYEYVRQNIKVVFM